MFIIILVPQNMKVLRQKVQRSFKNIEIVSNRMVFDNEGNLSAFKGMIVNLIDFVIS